MGHAQAEAETKRAMTAKRAAWKRQTADTQDSKLKRAVRRENMRVHRVCDAVYERFLGRHVQGLEKDLRQRDQRGLFQRIKSLNIEDTRKVSSQYICDEKSRMLRDLGLVLGRWAQFFGALLNAKSDKMKLDVIEGLPQKPVTRVLGVESTENELMVALRSMTNTKAVKTDELPVEIFRLGLNHDLDGAAGVPPDDQAGAWPTGSTAAMAGCRDKISALEEGQDRVRELSQHLTRSTRGQGPPQDRRYETRRLLRGEGTAAGGAVRVPPAPCDDGYNVHGLRTTRDGRESARAAVFVFHSSAEGARLCRSYTSSAGARSLRNSATDA